MGFFGKEGGIIVFGMDSVHSLFSVLLLVNYLMDFDQLEHIIIWDSKRDDKILVTLTYFQGHQCHLNLQTSLVCTLSSEPMARF